MRKEGRGKGRKMNKIEIGRWEDERWIRHEAEKGIKSVHAFSLH